MPSNRFSIQHDIQTQKFKILKYMFEIFLAKCSFKDVCFFTKWRSWSLKPIRNQDSGFEMLNLFRPSFQNSENAVPNIMFASTLVKKHMLSYMRVKKVSKSNHRIRNYPSLTKNTRFYRYLGHDALPVKSLTSTGLDSWVTTNFLKIWENFPMTPCCFSKESLNTAALNSSANTFTQLLTRELGIIFE